MVMMSSGGSTRELIALFRSELFLRFSKLKKISKRVMNSGVMKGMSMLG